MIFLKVSLTIELSSLFSGLLAYLLLVSSTVRCLLVRDQIHSPWAWQVYFLSLGISLCGTGHNFLSYLCRNKSISDHFTNVYDYLDLVSFLSLEPNLPPRVAIVNYVHGGYLPNIMSTIRQSWKSPVLSHSALLRLVLSWLTVHLWALYCLYLFLARMTEAVHRQMNASWQHVNHPQNKHLFCSWHHTSHHPLPLPWLQLQLKFELLYKTFLL